MSEVYKQKEYDLRNAIDNINSIPYVFESYVKETNYFIDKLLEETKEINTLRQELQQKENIIKETRDYIKEAIISESTEFYGLIDGEHVLAILERENKYGIS